MLHVQAAPLNDTSGRPEASSTAAAPAYPTDMGPTLGANTQTPPPPPPGAPKHEHHEYHSLMQQRHRERLSSHKNQVPVHFTSAQGIRLQACVRNVTSNSPETSVPHASKEDRIKVRFIGNAASVLPLQFMETMLADSGCSASSIRHCIFVAASDDHHCLC